MGKCFSVEKKAKNGAITKANKKSSKNQDSGQNENHDQDKSSIAVVSAKGNANVSFTREGNANITIRAGSRTNLDMYSFKDGATGKILETGNSTMLVEVDVNEKAQLKNADIKKEVNEKNDSKKANQSSSSEKVIYMTIQIIEKKETKRMPFSPKQKVSVVRDELVKIYKDFEFAIFGSDGQILDENKSFQENGVISDHVLKIGKEIYVSSNIDQSERAK